MTPRGRAPLVVAVVLLVGLAAVVVQRGRATEVTSPFGLAQGPRAIAMAQTATAAADVAVGLGPVCAPGGRPVTIRAVTLYGVDGSLRVTGFSVGDAETRPVRATAGCDSAAPEPFAVTVRRAGGESAHADGVEVGFEVDGKVRTIRLPRPVTVCRQLSEC